MEIEDLVKDLKEAKERGDIDRIIEIKKQLGHFE